MRWSLLWSAVRALDTGPWNCHFCILFCGEPDSSSWSLYSFSLVFSVIEVDVSFCFVFLYSARAQLNLEAVFSFVS